MGDDLQRSLNDRMMKMRAQALRGRSGGGLSGGNVVRNTSTPSTNFQASIPTENPSRSGSIYGGSTQGTNYTPGQVNANQPPINPHSMFNNGPGGAPVATNNTNVNSHNNTSSVSNTKSNNNNSSSNNNESDDDGAQKLREKLREMGINDTVAPLSQVEATTTVVRSAPKLDVSDRRSFLGHAPPKVGMVYCHIIRDRSGLKKLHPEYNLYLEVPGEDPFFLLAARKRKKNKSSNYLISMDPEDLNRYSGNFYGKVRSNFLGTEYTIYDKGEKGSKGGGLSLRQELGAVLYETNIVGSKGPRRMIAVIPSVDSTGKRSAWKPTIEDGESLINAYKAKDRKDDMIILENKKPNWNEELRAYILDFKGRVTVPSVKNFQLVERHTEKVLVQFGKIASDKFTLDFQHPVNGLQAFSQALTALDNKLACE